MPERLLPVARLITTTLDDLPLCFIATTLWIANIAAAKMVEMPEVVNLSGEMESLSDGIFGVSWLGTAVAGFFITGRLGLNLYRTWLDIIEKRQEIKARKIANDKARKELEEDNQ